MGDLEKVQIMGKKIFQKPEMAFHTAEDGILYC
jgi:hypothetical protein